jgi:hypothetical protein
VAGVLHKDLDMKFTRIRSIDFQGNSQRSLVVRQKYAKKMLGLIDEGKTILNVDQSWLNMLDFRHRKWVVRGQRNSLAFKPVVPRLSVLAAIDTQGSVYMALTMSHTDSDVLCLFLKRLFAKIELERPDFRQNTILLIDGAPYHRGDETHNYLCNLGVATVMGGPYGYQAAPIESFFALLKNSDLNPELLSCGKK